MIPAHIRIKFDNLLEQAKWHFHGANFRKTQALLAEAEVLVKNERGLVELREMDVLP